MVDMKSLKIEYNKILDLYNRGCKYLENASRTEQEFNKWCPKIIEYTEQLSIMINWYEEQTKTKLDNKTILEGFKNV